MPCVDSPQPGGLGYNELKTMIGFLLNTGLVKGMDITILDPDLDLNGRYATQLVRMLSELFQRPLNE